MKTESILFHLVTFSYIALIGAIYTCDRTFISKFLAMHSRCGNFENFFHRVITDRWMIKYSTERPPSHRECYTYQLHNSGAGVDINKYMFDEYGHVTNSSLTTSTDLVLRDDCIILHYSSGLLDIYVHLVWIDENIIFSHSCTTVEGCRGGPEGSLLVSCDLACDACFLSNLKLAHALWTTLGLTTVYEAPEACYSLVAHSSDVCVTSYDDTESAGKCVEESTRSYCSLDTDKSEL